MDGHAGRLQSKIRGEEYGRARGFVDGSRVSVQKGVWIASEHTPS